MKSSKNILKVAMTVVLATNILLSTTIVAEAKDLRGISSVRNEVFAASDERINTTVLTNYHATAVDGLVGVSTQTEFEDAVGLTAINILQDGEPVIYVSNSDCGPLAIEAINNATASVGALVGPKVELMMFKYADGHNQLMEEVLKPLRFVVNVPTGIREANREFAMLRLHKDGQTTILADLDTDPNTVTFETDKFSVFTMILAPTGTFDSYKMPVQEEIVIAPIV